MVFSFFTKFGIARQQTPGAMRWEYVKTNKKLQVKRTVSVRFQPKFQKQNEVLTGLKNLDFCFHPEIFILTWHSQRLVSTNRAPDT